MRIATLNNEKYGNITVDESIWTDKRSVVIDGVPLKKMEKKDFLYQKEGQNICVSITGNIFNGTTLHIGSDEILLTQKTPWYTIMSSAFIVCFVLIWSNIPFLFNIIPMVGGAIGLAVAAACSMLNVIFMARTDKLYIKLLIFLGFFALTVLICWLLAIFIIQVFF